MNRINYNSFLFKLSRFMLCAMAAIFCVLFIACKNEAPEINCEQTCTVYFSVKLETEVLSRVYRPEITPAIYKLSGTTTILGKEILVIDDIDLKLQDGKLILPDSGSTSPYAPSISFDTYDFTLKACDSSKNVIATKTVEQTFTTGGANGIEFVFTQRDLADYYNKETTETGSVNLTVRVKSDQIKTGYKYKLFVDSEESERVNDTNPTVVEGYSVFQAQSITDLTSGIHYFKIAFYESSSSTVSFCSKMECVQVVANITTNVDVTYDNINTFYTITYMKNQTEVFNSWVSGFNPVTSFNSSMSVTLPSENNMATEESFAGWYGNPECTGDAMTGWTAGEKREDVTLYAKRQTLTGTETVTATPEDSSYPTITLQEGTDPTNNVFAPGVKYTLTKGTNTEEFMHVKAFWSDDSTVTYINSYTEEWFGVNYTYSVSWPEYCLGYDYYDENSYTAPSSPNENGTFVWSTHEVHIIDELMEGEYLTKVRTQSDDKLTLVNKNIYPGSQQGLELIINGMVHKEDTNNPSSSNIGLNFTTSPEEIIDIVGTGDTNNGEIFVKNHKITGYTPSPGYYWATKIGETTILVWKNTEEISGIALKVKVQAEPKASITEALGYLVDNSEALYTGENDTLAESIEIPDDKTLTIASGATLTIASGATLTVKGKLIVKGKIIVNGSLVKEGNGQVQTEEGGSIVDGYGVEYIPQNI